MVTCCNAHQTFCTSKCGVKVRAIDLDYLGILASAGKDAALPGSYLPPVLLSRQGCCAPRLLPATCPPQQARMPALPGSCLLLLPPAACNLFTLLRV